MQKTFKLPWFRFFLIKVAICFKPGNRIFLKYWNFSLNNLSLANLVISYQKILSSLRKTNWVNLKLNYRSNPRLARFNCVSNLLNRTASYLLSITWIDRAQLYNTTKAAFLKCHNSTLEYIPHRHWQVHLEKSYLRLGKFWKYSQIQIFLLLQKLLE